MVLGPLTTKEASKARQIGSVTNFGFFRSRIHYSLFNQQMSGSVNKISSLLASLGSSQFEGLKKQVEEKKASVSSLKARFEQVAQVFLWLFASSSSSISCSISFAFFRM
jgi:dTDP-4-amino-4,6-dideoxygalactose transaminase